MAKVDEAQHDLELCVVVFGGASERFRGSLPLKDGELALAELQGWRPRLVFHSFGGDPWGESEAEAKRVDGLLPIADALVLTDASDAGMHYSASGLERLARTLQLVKPAIPTAIFGSAALAQEWATLIAHAPLIVAPPAAESGTPILKALVRVMLRPTGRPPPVRP